MINPIYKCHILICVNDRRSERQSCADGKGKEIHRILKEKVKAKGWSKQDIRVSKTLCLGLCSSGPNVLIYPQNILFTEVSLENISIILEKINEIMV